MAMPFRRPALQQQFVPRTSTSYADCAATTGGMMADADSRGKFVFNHQDVRRRTNEPVPDPGSPGLTIQQVADSLRRLTNGEVDMTVYPTGSDFTFLLDSLQDGKWAMVALWRGVIRDAGYGGTSPFRGGHASIYGYDQNEATHILGDPLTPRWLRVPPSVVQRACREFLIRVGVGAGPTDAYYGLSRDVYDPGAVMEGDDVAFNVGPITTHRDAVLKPNTVIYSDSALTKRYSHSDTSAEQPFGFNGSGTEFHVIINAGNTRYVRRQDVVRIINNDREFE